MKRMFSMMALGLLIAAGATGQTVRTGALKARTAAGVVKATADTTSGADTTYLQCADADLNQWNVVYSWALLPSLTGTSTGTVIAQGSNSGVFATVGDWVTLISDVTQYNGSSSTSISGSAAIYGYFILPKCQFKYVRLRYISAGVGQTSVMTGSYTKSALYTAGL